LRGKNKGKAVGSCWNYSGWSWTLSTTCLSLPFFCQADEFKVKHEKAKGAVRKQNWLTMQTKAEVAIPYFGTWNHASSCLDTPL
jgi:hypothetical protein